jgi:tyrosyl-DNA phosphodiesterase 2
MIQELKPYKFNKATGAWEEGRNAQAGLRASLTVVTFNVWFANYYFYTRCDALLEIVRDCDADVIGLQEVTPEFLQWLLGKQWVRDHYYLSDISGRTVDPYGVLLLSRFPVRSFLLHNLPSFMDRNLLVAELEVNEQTFQIGTVHLESMKEFAFMHKLQLETIFPLLKKSDHAILMGDFNFCATWEEKKALIDSRYQDMWSALRADEPGYTEDTDINLMRWLIKNKRKHVRFDRLLLGSPSWQPKSIRLLGTKPVSPEHPDIFPSDHFGLVATIGF